MSVMSLLLSRLDTGLESLGQMRDILAKAKARGDACPVSAQERKDILAILTPLAGAVNGKLIFSHRVNAAELAAFLKDQHHDDWAGCRNSVTEAEARIRSSNGSLSVADIAALRDIVDALDKQCIHLSARIGGY